MTDEPAEPRCANYGREPRDDEKPDDEWRAYADGVGDLYPYCEECARREFVPEAPRSDDRIRRQSR